jgi:C1A family cysteine protease
MGKMVGLKGMGWIRDHPDFRDYNPDHEEVSKLMKMVMKKNKKERTSVDLREWCSPVEDQGQIGSCTANAGVGMVEYFENRAFGKYMDASRLFLYKATRNLLHLTGDTGAELRTTMGALVLFGVPPEEFWPYSDDMRDIDSEPPAFCYAFAKKYNAIKYYRLDAAGSTPEALLDGIKKRLSTGLPSMFGFTVYSSITQADSDGKIPYPAEGERVVGGHALMAVGYDDRMKIRNRSKGAEETTGAILIRNSWGTGWGDGGYGWLPYEYVTSGLATDWWTLVKAQWIDTGNFQG